MKIHSLRHLLEGECITLTAGIDNLELWFRFPAILGASTKDASPFLTAAFVPAMLLGQEIEVDSSYSVSPLLVSSLEKINSAYSCWNPIYKKVRVAGNQVESVARNKVTGCFFSGGVDGTYSLLKNLEQVDYAILINGFDFTMDDTTWRLMIEKNQEFCKIIDRKLIPIETNFKSFTSAFGLARSSNYGSVLSAIGQALGFSRLILGAADTIDRIVPGGSHPITDPLWSTEATQIIHDGLEADRSGKVRFIMRNDAALANLWVCWKDPRYNCGQCSKCVRTWIAMQLNGLFDFKFESEIGLRSVKRLRIADDDDLIFLENFMHEAGRRHIIGIYRILRTKVMKYKLKQWLKQLIELFFPALNRWRLSRLPVEERQVEIGFSPHYADRFVRDRVLAAYARGELKQEKPVVGTTYEISGA